MDTMNHKLASLLTLPLEEKIEISKEYIREWYVENDGKVFVSFSGGKDSTALLHLCRQLYDDIPAVYLDTGLEYPEIDVFAKSTENVVCLKAEMSYEEVTSKYGYSVFTKKISEAVERYQNSKKNQEDLAELRNKVGNDYLFLKDIPCKVSNKCCLVLKEEPLNNYISKTNRKPMVAILAEETMGRMRRYINEGVNQFKNAVSHPIIFWNEMDVKKYLLDNNVEYCNIYGDLRTYGEKRTMCMYCMRGIHLEKTHNHIDGLKNLHEDKYEYFMNTLGMKNIVNYLMKERSINDK